jgi:hypothetical protein
LLTLHIEAATYMELRAKTIAALHAHLDDEAVAATPLPAPAPAPAPEEPKRRTPKAKADAAPVTPATPVAKKNDDLRRRFESLVNTDYDSALSILDALGVPNFKAAADGGMLDQLALAMEAFA